MDNIMTTFRVLTTFNKWLRLGATDIHSIIKHHGDVGIDSHTTLDIVLTDKRVIIFGIGVVIAFEKERYYFGEPGYDVMLVRLKQFIDSKLFE